MSQGLDARRPGLSRGLHIVSLVLLSTLASRKINQLTDSLSIYDLFHTVYCAL